MDSSDHKMVQESEVCVTVFKTHLIKERYNVKNIIKKRKQIATINAGGKTITYGLRRLSANKGNMSPQYNWCE